MQDIAIRGAQVIDGSGTPAVELDVGIKDGRIDILGDVGAAKQEINATGWVLAPGLIDTPRTRRWRLSPSSRYDL